MNLKEYIELDRRVSKEELAQTLESQVLQLKKIQYINAVLGFCEQLKEKIPEEIKNETLHLKLTCLPAHNWSSYIDITSESEVKSKNSYGFKDFFKDNVLRPIFDMYDTSSLVDFKFKLEDIDKLKEAMMGPEIFKEYSIIKLNVSLEEGLSDKSGNIRKKKFNRVV